MTEAIDYGDFGRRFVEQVVTEERVRATAESAASGDMTTSVKLAGGLVTAEGGGGANRVEVVRISAEPLTYRAALHARLELTVRIGGFPHRYSGEIQIPIVLTAVTQDDLSIFIDVADVAIGDIELDLQPATAAAGLVEQVGQVGPQVRREIARIVNDRKDHPNALAHRRIEVGAAIDAEWERRRLGAGAGEQDGAPPNNVAAAG